MKSLSWYDNFINALDRILRMLYDKSINSLKFFNNTFFLLIVLMSLLKSVQLLIIITLIWIVRKPDAATQIDFPYVLPKSLLNSEFNATAKVCFVLALVLIEGALFLNVLKLLNKEKI